MQNLTDQNVTQEEAYELLLENIESGYMHTRWQAEEYAEEINNADEGEYAVLEVEIDVGETFTDEFEDILFGIQEEYGFNPRSPDVDDETVDEAFEEYVENHDIDESITEEPLELYAEAHTHEIYTTGSEDGPTMMADPDLVFRTPGGGEKVYQNEVFQDIKDHLQENS